MSLAKKILDLTATAGPSTPIALRTQLSAPERFDDVLNALVDDHYLLEHRDSIAWRYGVLRYVWARRRRLTRGTP